MAPGVAPDGLAYGCGFGGGKSKFLGEIGGAALALVGLDGRGGLEFDFGGLLGGRGSLFDLLARSGEGRRGRRGRARLRGGRGGGSIPHRDFGSGHFFRLFRGGFGELVVVKAKSVKSKCW